MQVLTKVTYSKRFEKQLSKIPIHLKEKAAAWIDLVKFLGIREVAKSKGYHDEPLLGARWGHRSIRLNRSYRIIYEIIEDNIHIELLEVNKHDY